MNEVFFVILRRLRRPLIVLIIAYAVSIWGLALIPGVDEQGNPARMSFFHALYFISYTATTIGFGEIPHAFTDAQRMWTIVCIYLCVVAWAYALGSVFHLSQDQTLLNAIARRRFAQRVATREEPFVLIVGYGQSGIMLARMLDRMGQHMVIVEQRPERAARIEMEEFQHLPLYLAADGRLPDVLVDAGVSHRKCIAMVALAGDDDTNQAVAIGGTVLNPSLRIIARVHAAIAQANLESFRNIELINPFALFADGVCLDMGAPEKLRLIEWLSGLPGGQRPEPLNVPHGHWVVCGTGSFARYFAGALEQAGATCAVVPIDTSKQPDGSALQPQGKVAESLASAGVDRAVGLVACTDSDPINLATVTRARSLNSGLYIVFRQANAGNASLIDASMANLRFVKSEVVSHKARQLLTSPLLIRFLRHLDEEAGGELVRRTNALLEERVGDLVPFMWVFDCYGSYAGLREALAMAVDPPFRLGDLLVDPENPPARIPAVPLLLLRKKTEMCLPAEETRLLSGDRILFAGRLVDRERQRRFLLEPSPLIYLRTGVEPPRSWLFRYLQERFARRREEREARSARE